ncbi:MAG: C39 family peptidase [Lachnospiraceae bacterium]|nr:C39 family peptidase [Lachnospiraceae bacterium]
MLEKNEEAYEFVKGYPNRAAYMGKEIDLTKDCPAGEVPLLLQWDMRWGYDLYGGDMIGTAGCGPTCLTMAYLYLTGDISMNPRKMAEYAYDSGFYTEAGTSWDFFTLGTADLGLNGTELSLSEIQMKSALDNGELVICSMRPGDFTTTGHFILLRGYDEKGFYVNDPNSRKNSEKQWSFDRLSGQIKCLWRIGR